MNVIREDENKSLRRYISFIHKEFLLKICRDSGFEGLEYHGGPEVKCEVFRKTVVLESVSYKSGEESEEEAKKTANCCPNEVHTVDDILVYNIIL